MQTARSTTPKALLPSVLLLLFLTLFSTRAIIPASAEEVVIQNSLQPPFVIGVECPPLLTGEKGAKVVVPPGSKATVTLPAEVGAEKLPPTSSGYVCVGSWEEVDGVVRFAAYSYARDHGRCGGGKGKCAVDVRPDGVYAWDGASKRWVKLQDLAYRLLVKGGRN